jgi:hypothetical protein
MLGELSVLIFVTDAGASSARTIGGGWQLARSTQFDGPMPEKKSGDRRSGVTII